MACRREHTGKVAIGEQALPASAVAPSRALLISGPSTHSSCAVVLKFSLARAAANPCTRNTATCRDEALNAAHSGWESLSTSTWLATAVESGV